MKYKASTNTTITRNTEEIEKKIGNIYETVAVIAKRANQISSEVREELSGKLSEFTSSTDNLEEVFENREQIELSKHYEKMPKPTLYAIEEFMEGNVYFRKPTPEADADSSSTTA